MNSKKGMHIQALVLFLPNIITGLQLGAVLDSACSMVAQILSFSTFLHSTDHGYIFLAAAENNISSPGAPIGVERTSSVVKAFLKDKSVSRTNC
jgi:hypothetical protein